MPTPITRAAGRRERQPITWLATSGRGTLVRRILNERPIMKHDPVNHPQHYTQHPSGIECIQITEHMCFNLGNAIKYIWRADLKAGMQDLEKARWYLDREIERRKKAFDVHLSDVLKRA
jgi:hypothetical protein